MTQQCFEHYDSSSPVCGVHKVPLKQNQILIDANAPGLGRVICYQCPVSQAVVREVSKIQNVKPKQTAKAVCL